MPSKEGKVVWITGRAGAGKTTFAYVLKRIYQRGRKTAIVIDGDHWREIFNNHDYSDEGRRQNIVSAGKMAGFLESEGLYVICAFVSPKAEWRREALSHCKGVKMVYLHGGMLWEGTSYEEPQEDEMGKTNDVVTELGGYSWKLRM